MHLYKRKIFFVGPILYDYNKNIINELEKKGAIVTFIQEKSYNFIFNFAQSLNSKIYRKLCNLHKNKIKSYLSRYEYDYVFIIRGEILDEDFLVDLKKLSKKAIWIMYQWDSNTNIEYFSKVHLFDKCFSFDLGDCKSNKDVKLLHLFYTQEFEKIRFRVVPRCGCADLLFIGAVHSNRYERIKDIEKKLNKSGLKFKVVMYASPLDYIKRIVRGRGVSGIRIFPIKKEKLIELISQTYVVLDLVSPTQTGLTIRTIETLAAGKSILTSNINIRSTDLYNSAYCKIFSLDEDLDTKLKKLISEGSNSYILSDQVKNIQLELGSIQSFHMGR